MRIIKSLFILIAILSSGCATISSDYTPSPLDVPKYQNSSRQDISFSVDLISEIGQFQIIDKEDIVSVVKEKLKQTGHYKKIVYAPFSKRSDKHLHFQFVISGTKENEAQALGMLSGLSLMTIPVIMDYYSDMSVFAIENNKETFSASAAEKINKTLWLPFIVVAPVLNDYLTGNRVINKQISYLVSEVANNATGNQAAQFAQ